MVVGNEKVAVVLVLHADEIAEGTEVVAQMEIACGTNAAADDFSLDDICHSQLRLLCLVLNRDYRIPRFQIKCKGTKKI